MDLREKAYDAWKKLDQMVVSVVGGGVLDDAAIDYLEQFAQSIRNEVLEQVLAGISREQDYREYRMDLGEQDGSAVGACKEIAGYVRALKK